MSRKVKRSGLFHGFWYDLSGHKLRRASRSSLAEAYRLWALHKDIREGVVGAGGARELARSKDRMPSTGPGRLLREHPAYVEENPFH